MSLSLEPFPKLNILQAFYYWKPAIEKLFIEHADDMCLMVDSGAFSVAKSGKTITLDMYCEFVSGLREMPLDLHGYIALDVIGDPVATRANYYEMLKRGFEPIPVITNGMTDDDVERYYETSDIICLGGLVDPSVRASIKAGRVANVLKIANGRKVHLLGYTNINMLKYFRPYSCDSSSWSSAARYASIMIYHGHGLMKGYHTDSAAKGFDESDFDAARGLGFDLHRAAKQSNRIGGASILRDLSIASWVAMSVDFEQVLGVKLFIAKQDTATFRSFMEAYALQRERYNKVRQLRSNFG